MSRKRSKVQCEKTSNTKDINKESETVKQNSEEKKMKSDKISKKNNHLKKTSENSVRVKGNKENAILNSVSESGKKKQKLLGKKVKDLAKKEKELINTSNKVINENVNTSPVLKAKKRKHLNGDTPTEAPVVDDTSEIKRKKKNKAKNKNVSMDRIETENVMISSNKVKKTQKKKQLEIPESGSFVKKIKMNKEQIEETDQLNLSEKSVDSKMELNSNANSSAVKSKRKKNNWKKRRNMNAIVLIQNVPSSIILKYKQVLMDHFSKYGKIHSVGIADFKCDANSKNKPVFTTRIFFKTEEAATEALQEDKTIFEGRRIRVKKFDSSLKTKKITSGNKSRKQEVQPVDSNVELRDNLEEIVSDSD